MPAAVGTSLLVIAINSAAALAVRLGSQVGLDWLLLGVFTAAALTGVLAGHSVASRVDASRLTTAFTVLLIAVAGYSLARSSRTSLAARRPRVSAGTSGAAGGAHR